MVGRKTHNQNRQTIVDGFFGAIGLNKSSGKYQLLNYYFSIIVFKQIFKEVNLGTKMFFLMLNFSNINLFFFYLKIRFFTINTFVFYVYKSFSTKLVNIFFPFLSNFNDTKHFGIKIQTIFISFSNLQS